MTALSASTRNRVDAVFSLAKRQGGMAKRQGGEEETLSHWARYLCVLASGYVEVSLQSILSSYASERSHRDVANYVESRLERVTNLNEESVYQLLISFRPEWGEVFRSRRTDAQKDALDSVVANRNLIAHGRSVGLTLARVTAYYRELVRVIELIEKHCVR
jgi:hypothetical protein